MGGLQLPQLAQQGVVAGVVDRRRVEHVVRVVVALDLASQVVDADDDVDAHIATPRIAASSAGVSAIASGAAASSDARSPAPQATATAAVPAARAASTS